MSEFHKFASAVRQRFDEMAKEKLFCVEIDKEQIWEKYLGAFPEGTNPMYRKRTEHDCSCCRHFIRSVGNVVAIQNGALSTIWDLNGLPSPYQEVADAMSAHIKSKKIENIFLTKFAQHGNEETIEKLPNGATVPWRHFVAHVPKKHVSNDPTPRLGETRTTHEMLETAVKTIKPEATQDVLSLIAEGNLYRGNEFRKSVDGFNQLQQQVLGSPVPLDILLWTLVDHPQARFKNTVIGTLVTDLSEGTDLEVAVKKYEAKTAPENYRRPKALITPAMIKDALKTVKELDLEPALERRHARLSDVSINSVLFASGDAKLVMKGGLESLLMTEVQKTLPDLTHAENVTPEQFMQVLMNTTHVTIKLEHSMHPNFVSLTAPVKDDVQPLFRWGNNFAWSYEGNVTDSIKDKVKAAGGKVEGIDLRVSLAWFNTDDLDLHSQTVGEHIYYPYKRQVHKSGGMLDVDMNAGVGTTTTPVENIRWEKILKDGTYKIGVHQFARRNSSNVGFVLEVESKQLGVQSYRYDKMVSDMINAVTIVVEDKKVVSVTPSKHMVGGGVSTEKWGLSIPDMVKVNAIVLSPNHWMDDAEGQRHWFFILEGCRNPDPVRGIYNEFLRPDMMKHRKVFEVLGDKTKAPYADDQMSGVGFSAGRGNKVTAVVQGPKLNKAYTINF